MPGHIEQNIPDRIPDLAGGPEDSQVVAIPEEAPAPPERTAHCPHHPPGERLHPATEGMLVLRLHDEVCVIWQERVVHQPELSTLAASRESLLKRPHEGRGPQRRGSPAHAQRQVARVARRKLRPTPVTNPRMRPRLRSRRLAPTPVPCGRPQLKHQLLSVWLFHLFTDMC